MSFEILPQDPPKTASVVRRFVLPETIMLVVIGGLDLLSTIYLVATNQAREANPFMNAVLNMFGPTGFAIVKGLLLAVPLTICELARAKNELLVKWALRFAIVAYLVLYIASFVVRNR